MTEMMISGLSENFGTRCNGGNANDKHHLIRPYWCRTRSRPMVLDYLHNPYLTLHGQGNHRSRKGDVLNDLIRQRNGGINPDCLCTRPVWCNCFRNLLHRNNNCEIAQKKRETQMKILTIILGLIVAALTWWLIFFIMSLTIYIAQEINHEIRKAKRNFKQSMWDLEWALKH